MIVVDLFKAAACAAALPANVVGVTICLATALFTAAGATAWTLGLVLVGVAGLLADGVAGVEEAEVVALVLGVVEVVGVTG